jgi:hypothetical protein
MKLFDGDIFECGSRKFQFKTAFDDTSDAPWDREDGHGPVTNWVKREKRPHERLLNECRGGFKRYYDMQEAQRIALRDGWDAAPFGEGTRRQRAARAVEADFQRLYGWCHDRWGYIGIIVEEVDSGEGGSLWGIESDCRDYHVEVADELAAEINARLNDAMAKDIEASRPDMHIPPSPSVYGDTFWRPGSMTHGR